jgi:hypothetical protein
VFSFFAQAEQMCSLNSASNEWILTIQFSNKAAADVIRRGLILLEISWCMCDSKPVAVFVHRLGSN